MTEPTFDADLDGLTNEMAGSRVDLVSAVQALSGTDLAKVRRGGWPVHRVLEHVIESEWLYATLTAHLQGKPVPERGKTSCEGQPVDEVLRMLEASRSAVLRTLEGVGEDVFYDVVRMGHEEYSVYSVLENVANHDREHAGQISAIVATA
jgi:uncharacterized damage-inducible protein DinB